MIEFFNVTKKYSNGVVALDNINLKINDGEFIFLVGQSGAGKSTLLKLIYKEEDVSRGSIVFDGKNVTKISKRRIPFYRRNMGVVYQDFKLLSNRTVFENVAYALEIIGAGGNKIKYEVERVLSLVNLSEKAKCYPNELSGGESQRVSIARAVVNKPKLLIADEPTGNLDMETAGEIMKVLEDINNSGTTVMMATHAKHIVDEHQKRVINLSDGKVIRDCIGGYDCEIFENI